MALRELENRVHRLRIVLEGTEPQVWRLVEVPADLRLSQLHLVVQVVMGWEDTHPHAFEFAGRRYSEEGGLGTGDLDEFENGVGDVLHRKGAEGVYTYDFGDDWRHLIVVEATGEAEPDVFYPRVLDGHGGGPPEDCGDAEDQRMWVEMLETDELDLDLVQEDLREVFDGTALEEGDVMADEDLPPVRPVSLPPEEELAALAVETSPLRELLALARWVSPGRKLTGTGVPRPDDVRAAVEELDLWPYASEEETRGRAERVKRLRAARDLPEFVDLWRDAVELGLIEVGSANAHTCPELVGAGPAPDRVLEWWTVLFGADVDGSASEGDAPFGPYSGLELVYVLLRVLYEAPDEFETGLAEVADLMDTGIGQELPELGDAGGLEGAGAPADLSTDGSALVGGTLLPSLYRSVLRIARGGGLRLVDATPAGVREAVLDPAPSGSAPGADRPAPVIDCSVVLTPLGRYGLRQMLLRSGVPAPLSGEMAGADAAEFLDALGAVPPELYSAEIAPWLAARTPSEAVRQVVEAASEPTGTGALRRALGTEVLGSAGEAALPELRALLGSDRPEVSGLAAGALLAAPGLAEEERAALHVEFGPWMAIDRMAGPLEMGEEGFAYLLGLTTEEGAEPIGQALVGGTEQMWKVDHPATVPVLEALGRLHPDKKTAKAARRAAHKARSRS